MNETLQTIHKRRSIRSYKPDPIPREDLETIVGAGKAAASGMNRQPYHITVVQKPEALNELEELARAEALKGPMAEMAKRPDFKPTYGAPAMILVSADPSLPTAIFDAAMVMGNMFLAARSLGIGSCWLFMFGVMADSPDAKKVYAKLGVPEGYKVIAGAAFGYPSGDWPEPREKRTDNVNYVL
jgi:nitroreductase